MKKNNICKVNNMRNIVLSLFLMLILLCSCSERNETALDWFNKSIPLIKIEPKTAIEYLNNAIKLRPDYAIAYNNRGVAYARLNQYQRAIEDFNEALLLKPDSSDTYVNRGMAYILLGNDDNGCHDVQKACSMGSCRGLKWAKERGSCR
jgi:tetratricopeptide (TPR) repeat protein